MMAMSSQRAMQCKSIIRLSSAHFCLARQPTIQHMFSILLFHYISKRKGTFLGPSWFLWNQKRQYPIFFCSCSLFLISKDLWLFSHGFSLHGHKLFHIPKKELDFMIGPRVLNWFLFWENNLFLLLLFLPLIGTK